MIFHIRIFKHLCPLWRRHVDMTWNFKLINKFYFFCKHCPLKDLNSVGRAYRITIGEES